MRERRIVIFVSMIFLFIGVHRTYGGERVILLDSGDVRATSPRGSTSGQSYVITLPVPQGIVGDKIHGAVLEFYADVFGPDGEAYQSESALVEVYGVDGDVVGDMDPRQLRRPSAMTRNVVVGEAQRVLVDITEFLRYNLRQENTTASLVVGFVQAHDGVFRIREDAFGMGKPVRLTIVELPRAADH
jgi:hypothetical protein